MEHSLPGGIDADGFILPAPNAHPQPEFQALLADACGALMQVEPLLDGIYLYGSVARGDARPGVSDLDLTLVLRHPATAEQSTTLECIRLALHKRHPEVTKVDFDIGLRSQVLAPENAFSWGYWLKHHCRCLWGDDLGKHFERFKPSREIALAVNGDFEAVLTRYATLVDQATTPAESQRLRREASRKLIRSTQVLRAKDAPGWPQTLEEHVDLFLQRYPSMASRIAFFMSQAKGQGTQPVDFSTRLRSFLGWMVSQHH